MQDIEEATGPVRRAVNDLAVAQMLLVQATVESTTAIGQGINELGNQISGDGEGRGGSPSSISNILLRTADGAVEPYTTRFRYLRGMLVGDS